MKNTCNVIIDPRLILKMKSPSSDDGHLPYVDTQPVVQAYEESLDRLCEYSDDNGSLYRELTKMRAVISHAPELFPGMIPTMCMGNSSIVIDPYFAACLLNNGGYECIMFVLVHLLTHRGFAHPEEMKESVETGGCVDSVKIHMAQDYEINYAIEKLSLSKTEKLFSPGIARRCFGLFEKKYGKRAMLWEEIYSELKDDSSVEYNGDTYANLNVFTLYGQFETIRQSLAELFPTVNEIPVNNFMPTVLFDKDDFARSVDAFADRVGERLASCPRWRQQLIGFLSGLSGGTRGGGFRKNVYKFGNVYARYRESVSPRGKCVVYIGSSVPHGCESENLTSAIAEKVFRLIRSCGFPKVDMMLFDTEIHSYPKVKLETIKSPEWGSEVSAAGIKPDVCTVYQHILDEYTTPSGSLKTDVDAFVIISEMSAFSNSPVGGRMENNDGFPPLNRRILEKMFYVVYNETYTDAFASDLKYYLSDKISRYSQCCALNSMDWIESLRD